MLDKGLEKQERGEFQDYNFSLFFISNRFTNSRESK